MIRSPCTLPGREGIAGYLHRITLTPYRGVTRCPSVGVHRPARGRHICGACREGFLRHLVFGGAARIKARCRPVFSRSGPGWGRYILFSARPTARGAEVRSPPAPGRRAKQHGPKGREIRAAGGSEMKKPARWPACGTSGRTSP